MRKNGKTPECALLALLGGLFAITACAGIIDEALVWKQGADEIDPETTFARSEEEVVSPWNGHTNAMTVLRMNQTATQAITVPLSSIITTNITMMTLHLRCKWEGTFVTGTSYKRAYLFSYGKWNQYRGISFSFIPLDNGSFSTRFDCGRTQDPMTSPTIETNVWYDAFLTVQDPAPDSTESHNVYTHCYLFKDACAITDCNISASWPSWRTTSGNYRSAALYPTDSLSFANQFRGSIARIGFWNRVLTKGEMVELSARPHNEGRLLRLTGGELNATTPEWKATFLEKGHGVYVSSTESYAYRQTLPNVLTIKTLAESEICAVDVTIDAGTAQERHVKSPTLYPGEATQVYVKELSIGSHALTIRRISGTAKIDFVELSGSWSIGDYCYNILTNWKQYTGNITPYAIGTETPKELAASLSREGEVKNSDYTTLLFTLTPEMARLGYGLEIATGQTKGCVAPNFVVYVNGEEFCRKATPWYFANVSIPFPAGTFKGGENQIALRYDASKHVSDYWAALRGFRMTVTKEGLPKYGSAVILR